MAKEIILKVNELALCPKCGTALAFDSCGMGEDGIIEIESWCKQCRLHRSVLIKTQNP